MPLTKFRNKIQTDIGMKMKKKAYHVHDILIMIIPMIINYSE